MRKGCTNVNSISYYENNSGAFIEQTKALDMSEIYSRFLRHIRPQGLILDAGCGAGRDICAFRSKGYEVEAFDASEKSGESFVIDADYVNSHLESLVDNEDLSRFIL